MPIPEHLRMIRLDQLQWPVTYRFMTSSPHGFSSTELTLDMWRMIDRPEETKSAGPLIWERSVALATSRSVRLELVEVMMWKLPTGPQIVDPGDHVGRNALAPSDREHSLIIAMHDNVVDRRSTRRLAIFGFPRVWHRDGVLTSDGWDVGMQLGNVMGMSFSHDYIGGGFQQLHHWTGVEQFSLDNIFGVAFRRVTSWSVCQYVDKAPDYELGLWPDRPL